ncbi:MAG: NAD(P)H-dependent glycerol-3-phosphate dehydrogenase [Lentisphaeria bacterium]
MKVTVISDGGWGTAIALTLNDNGHEVKIWGAFADYIEQMSSSRENSRFLKGIKLPEELYLTSNLDEAMSEAEVIILATPSQYLRNSLKLLSKYDNSKRIFVDLAKGIEVGSLKRMSEIVEELLGEVHYVCLSGPSHAEEVARKIPTTVIAASESLADAKIIQEIFNNDYFRVYTSNDLVGAELGGALKNIFAIAAGVIDGLGLGDNTKAALMTRGVVELSRIGVALGGKEQTFSGLSGIGDLIVTCMSQHSRNRHVGEELGKGKSLAAITQEMGMVVAEGVRTTESAYLLAQHHKIEVPIIGEVYACLYENKDPKQAIRDLMNRPARAEN